MGPFKPTAHGRYKFVSKITDMFTKWTAVFLLCSKDQVLVSLQLFLTSTVILIGKRISSDGVPTTKANLRVTKFKDYCRSTGVIQKFAAANTPQQIGVPESVGRTLCGMARCMLVDIELPPSIWGELMITASYRCNRILHFVAQDGNTV